MPDSPILTLDELRQRHIARHGDIHDDNVADLRAAIDEARQAHDDALEALHRAAGPAALTASQQRKWDGHERERRILEEESAALTRQMNAARDARVAERRAKWGSVQVSSDSGRSTWARLGGDLRSESPAGWVSRAHSAVTQTEGLSDLAREQLTRALAEPGADQVARYVVTRSNPDYASAFTKVLANPERGWHTFTPAESAAFAAVEATRAAWGTGTATAGYLVPLALDPNLAALVNDGTANPFRSYAHITTAPSSPARVITSTGVTAAWTAEGDPFGDNTPAFGKVDVPLHKLTAWITGSYEIFEDAGPALAAALPMLLADARDRAESAAFATGNGTTAPKGLVTALSAVTGSIVTATTRGSFTTASTVDMFALLNSVPPRARQSASMAFLANLTHLSTVAQMVAGTGGVPLVDMAAKPTLWGFPLLEASSMTTASTSGSYLMVAGDLAKYCIVDHVAGPSLEYVPVVFDQATGRPSGTRGWVFHARVGADMLDPTQARILLA